MMGDVEKCQKNAVRGSRAPGAVGSSNNASLGAMRATDTMLSAFDQGHRHGAATPDTVATDESAPSCGRGRAVPPESEPRLMSRLKLQFHRNYKSKRHQLEILSKTKERHTGLEHSLIRRFPDLLDVVSVMQQADIGQARLPRTGAAGDTDSEDSENASPVMPIRLVRNKIHEEVERSITVGHSTVGPARTSRHRLRARLGFVCWGSFVGRIRWH